MTASVWEHFGGDLKRAFEPGEHGQVAVKVIRRQGKRAYGDKKPQGGFQMSGYEEPEPIINSPFDLPNQHWYLKRGETPLLRPGRRPSLVYAPQDGSRGWDISDGALVKSKDYAPAYEIALVNRIRERVNAWRSQQWVGVTRTTLDLLQWWYRDGRASRLFFAQREAAETVIFLTEARLDFLQGINVPIDEPSEEQKTEGSNLFGGLPAKWRQAQGRPQSWQ